MEATSHQEYHRGNIFYANLEPHLGCEQGGIRPVLVIQNDLGNKHSKTLIVSALTSRTISKAKLPKTITIKHTIQETQVDGKYTLVACDTTKTKSSCRTLPLVDPYEKMLLRMKSNQAENRRLCGSYYNQNYLDYIFVNEIGEIIKPGYVSAHFADVLEKHNMPCIRFHDLRHSCATMLFAQGVPMKEIQAWLGHSTIGTTANIYTHLDENSKINSANAIIGIFAKKRAPRVLKHWVPDGKWCTKAIQIRTGIVLYGILHIVQGDGSGAVLVVEGENQFIIVQVDGVHKGVDQHFAVGLLAYIQPAEFVEPEGYELRADSGPHNLLVGNLDFQILLGGFQFL